jgi:hypothetical protein
MLLNVCHFQKSVLSILTVCDVMFRVDFTSFFLQQVQRLTVTQQKVEMLSRKTMVTWKQVMLSWGNTCNLVAMLLIL